MENRKIRAIDIIAFIVFFVIILGFAILAPFKDTITCDNNTCRVRTYSLLMTQNAYYDLSQTKLHIYRRIVRGGNKGLPHGEIYISPITKCPYFTLNKAEKERELIENNDYIVLKHIGIWNIFLFFLCFFVYLILPLKLYLPFTKKKYVKYLMQAVLIRFLYILIV